MTSTSLISTKWRTIIMTNTDWPDLKFIVDGLITNSPDGKYLNLIFALQYFVFLQKDFGNFHNQRRVVIYDLKNMADYQE